jgi:hypothetical protein
VAASIERCPVQHQPGQTTEQMWAVLVTQREWLREQKTARADPALMPFVLQPGQVVEGADIPCRAAALFAAKALKTGHLVKVTRSLWLEPPGNALRPTWERRAGVVVRWRYGDSHAGWCSWEARGEGGAWAFETAQVARINDPDPARYEVELPQVISATTAGDWVATCGDQLALALRVWERNMKSEIKRAEGKRS